MAFLQSQTEVTIYRFPKTIFETYKLGEIPPAGRLNQIFNFIKIFSFITPPFMAYTLLIAVLSDSVPHLYHITLFTYTEIVGRALCLR